MDIYKVNVAGTLFSAIAFLDLLDNLKQMSQVLIASSVAGFYRDWQLPGIGSTTSNAAMNNLAKCLAQFFMQLRIRVNSVAPGRKCDLLKGPKCYFERQRRGINANGDEIVFNS